MKDVTNRIVQLDGDDLEKMIIEKFNLSENHKFEWSERPDIVHVTDFSPKPNPLNKPAGLRGFKHDLARST